MRRTTLLAALTLALSPILIGVFTFYANQRTDLISKDYEEKVYVAIETEGRVGVIDTKTNRLIKSIDLTEVVDGTSVKYTTHNVQVAPNGELVFVTANVERGVMGEENEDREVSDGLPDKVFLIDPLTDTVTGSLPIAIDSHLAHIVADKSGTFAYIASQEKGEIYKIDLKNKRILSTVTLGVSSEPHGMRLAADDSKLYVALIGGRAIAEVDLTDYSIREYPLSGAVVQTAITRDGRYVFGSVYDTKKVAWINTQTKEQGYIDLPEDAKGSVQLYATPDSKYLYVVNQGYYFDQPIGNTVYRIDIIQKKVEQVIPTGDAPHGIVIDKAGRFVYVTNLLSKDMSIIDVQSNKEVARIKIGEMPNGISIWNRHMGGTP